MTIKAIIYDCGGVLLIKKKNYLPSQKIREIDKLCSQAKNEKVFWGKISKQYSLREADLSKIINTIASGYKKNLPMWQFHNQIKRKYKTGIINNGTSAIFSLWRKKFSLDKELDELLNSSELKVRKPNKLIYQLMCRKLKVLPEEAIFIDNKEVHIFGARKAGLKGILYDVSVHSQFLKKILSILKRKD